MAKPSPKLPLLKPMLAITGEPFDSPDFLFEVKWDGIRCLAYLTGETVLYSRNGNDLTYRYPELAGLHREVTGGPMILDGEIVVFEGDKPSFHRLLARDRLHNNFRIRQAAATYPAVLMVFDLLYYKGESQMGLPLKARKQLLADLPVSCPNLRLSEYILKDGVEFYQAVCRLELEGMIAKQLDSLYFPGKRSHCWHKIKRIFEEDLVICGYTRGKGRRQSLGSLILGGYQGDRLVYAGLVGSGLSEEGIQEIQQLLQPLKREQSPLDHFPTLPQAEWVAPELVCTVKFLERTNSGEIRHSSFNGLRFDKEPEECRLSQ
ncbi:MAG: non-homologous end-joining DNA ligase [Clostridia bacterium]|nr:non-homologous end-joining DNA ligase [Clostridia bacterium]